MFVIYTYSGFINTNEVVRMRGIQTTLTVKRVSRYTVYLSNGRALKIGDLVRIVYNGQAYVTNPEKLKAVINSYVYQDLNGINEMAKLSPSARKMRVAKIFDGRIYFDDGQSVTYNNFESLLNAGMLYVTNISAFKNGL